jgi:hypothetical protein
VRDGSVMQTEFTFVLPRGLVGRDGEVHREGTMRLATAADEILPLRDPRVKSNSAYLVVILLSRVVIRLGALPAVTPREVEALFAADLAYLQDFYNRINGNGTAVVSVRCPGCGASFEVEPETAGES